MRRTLIAVALASTLVSIPSGRFLQPFWDLVSSLWAAPAQGGCGMDPSGGCLPQQPKLDGGCGMDPDGRCLQPPQPRLDAGCGMDPNGKCQPGS
jgi:hypothetical protein